MRSQYCFKQKTGTIIAIIVLIFVFAYISTVAYSAINSTMTITGGAIARIEKNIRVSNVKLLSVESGGVELYSSNYSVNTITTGIDLKSLDSKVTYQITVVNSGNEDMTIGNIYKQANTNSNIVFDCDYETYTKVDANSTITINITYRYDSSVTSLPSVTTLEDSIYLQFENMPKPVLASQNSWYRGSTDRSLITSISIADKYEVPADKTVIESWDASDGSKKSVTAYVLDDYSLVLSGNGEGNGKVFANPDSMYAFGYSNESYSFVNCSVIDASLLDTSNVTDMNRMFGHVGFSAESTEIKGLDKFDVSNVISMTYMFSYAGYNSKTLNISGLDDWNTSKVTRMEGLFSNVGYLSTTWSIGYLSGWDTGSVIYMNSMFEKAGYSAPIWNIGTLNNWDTSNVTNMTELFSSAGRSATTWSIGNLENWDTSKVTNMSYMFEYSGYNVSSWNVGNVGKWNVSNVTNMSNMFNRCGYNATTWYAGDLGNWDTSNVTNMEGLFYVAGRKDKNWTIGNIENWDTSNVTNMSYVFNNAGYSATNWYVGDLGKWNTSNVKKMSGMFNATGHMSDTVDLGDLSKWDTSNVTNMSYMFCYIGLVAKSVNFGNLSNWDTSNVTNMERMFFEVTKSELDLSGWNTAKVTNMVKMFYSCDKLTVIYIGSGWNTSNVTSSTDMFYEAVLLPNFDSTVIDKTNAHGDTGGYMTKVVNFTIDGVKYKALKGMTWTQWIDSEYNTRGDMKDWGYCVGTTDWNYYIVHGSTMIKPTNVISDADYTLQYN